MTALRAPHRLAPGPTAARRAKEALAGPGRPLAPSVRAAVGRRLGHDLADVRVHEGPRVRAAATGLGAAGFTLGHDVGLAEHSGERGSALLVHELVHVVQQGSGRPSAEGRDAAEREASDMAQGRHGDVLAWRPVELACAPADWLSSSPDVRRWSTEQLRAEIAALEDWMTDHTGTSVDAERIFAARDVVSTELDRRTAGATSGTRPAVAGAPARASAPSALEAASPGVLGTLGGALMGEFEEDPTIGMIAIDTGVSLIPVVDQAADIRDVIAHLYWMIERGQHTRVMRWVGLTLSLIGAIPEIGTAIKGASKIVIKSVREALSHLDEILGITRRLLPAGGSLRRLLDFIRSHWARWTAFGTDVWHSALDRAGSALSSLFGALVPGRARLLAGIAEVRRRSATMLSSAFARLLAMVDDGMARLLRAVDIDPATLGRIGGPELATDGAVRLESRAASASDDVVAGVAHGGVPSSTATGTGAGGPAVGLAPAQRSDSLAPEVAAGFARAHVRPLGALLGATFDTPRLQRLEVLWRQVENVGEVATLSARNSRRLFNNHRGRFWRAVADDPEAAQLFIDAGMVFRRRGTAPVYVRTGGREVRATIDHVLERQSAPGRALDPTNLQLSLTRENTVVLRLVTALDPFQGARAERRLVEHEEEISRGIDDLVSRWCDVPGP